jgi:hypothetical protein
MFIVSDLLNPVTHSSTHRTRCVSSPVIPIHNRHYQQQIEDDNNNHNGMIGKPRSRFSEYEDNIIRNGVAQRLTWGQISDLLPHRKRATCFNRYRTLQGVRKSRKQSTSESGSPVMTCSLSTSSSSVSPLSPVQSCFNGLPTTPPPCLSLPPLMTNTSWSSTDIIYPISKHQPNYNYVSDINNNSSSDSSFSSCDEDDQFIARISLSAITRQPYYNL